MADRVTAAVPDAEDALLGSGTEEAKKPRALAGESRRAGLAPDETAQVRTRGGPPMRLPPGTATE